MRKVIVILLGLGFLSGCLNPSEPIASEEFSQAPAAIPTPPEFADYWYSGEAEISSYRLEQARYGAIFSGEAVLIYVTEPFSSKNFTKADNPNEEDQNVLKLNATRKFTTGIYPYSIMSSSFFPLESGDRVLKVSSSSQEWCGHTYMEMRFKEKMHFDIYSYFEGENLRDSLLESQWMEEDLWSLIRLQPAALPTDSFQIIPSTVFLRLKHIPLKAYPALAELTSPNDSCLRYSLRIPTLERELHIDFQKAFPHRILAWEERYRSGFGDQAQLMTTTAGLINTIKTPYWEKNQPGDEVLRKELGL